MEITGKIIARPATESGVSAKGPWRKAFVVVRYEEGQYPKDILLYNMRKAEEFERLQNGQEVKFKFDAKTRQASSGRWYCELECWDWSVQPAQAAPNNDDPL